MIKRIELINFMSHRHTVIEPSDGLTVLVGPNNCGKSAVVTALQILAGNEPSTYVGRHGESRCAIYVETDEGHSIEWSRGKNKSPKYLINGQTYDRLKGGVPEALLSTLRLTKVTRGQTKEAFDIHFGQQKSPVFLVNDSPRAAADFFAASSDAGLLLEMQVLHRQKSRDAKQQLAKLSDQSDYLSAKNRCLQEIPGLQREFEDCLKRQADVAGNEMRIGQLRGSIRQVEQQQRHLNWFSAQSKVLSDVLPQPNYQPTDDLQELISSIGKQQILVRRAADDCSALNDLTAVPALSETGPLIDAIVTIQQQQALAAKAELELAMLDELAMPPEMTDPRMLATLVDRWAARQSELDDFQRQLDQVADAIDLIVDQVQRWLADNPTCPTCGNDVTANELLCHSLDRGGSHG